MARIQSRRVANRIGSGGPYEETVGYSRMVVIDDIALVAGCTSIVDGAVAHVGDAYGQTLQAIQNALDALARVEMTASDVFRTRLYVVGREHIEAVGAAHGAIFGQIRPVATMVLVAGLIDPDMLVEVEVEALLQ
jgi:enamine deaminase RidA (YjgF/YER057c/UK114 family)